MAINGHRCTIEISRKLLFADVLNDPRRAGLINRRLALLARFELATLRLTAGLRNCKWLIRCRLRPAHVKSRPSIGQRWATYRENKAVGSKRAPISNTEEIKIFS